MSTAPCHDQRAKDVFNTVHLRAKDGVWELYDTKRPSKPIGIFGSLQTAERAWDEAFAAAQKVRTQ